MNFYYDSDVLDFFDVSVILPFYKKMKEFKKVLPKNLHYLQRNGIEVIIVLDTPCEMNELVCYLKEFSFLNAKVVCNKNHHEWRNPSKALNVGIRHSSKKYVFVASPETEFLSDVIYQLRYILNFYPETFAVGRTAFVDINHDVSFESIDDLELLIYGSFMVEKKYLDSIKGYSEAFTKWGGDDDNIRIRLELLGIEKMVVEQAIGLHREEFSQGHKSRFQKSKEIPIDLFKEIYYPNNHTVNEENWGLDFNEIIYSWELRNNRYEQCNLFLKDFKKHWIRDREVFNNTFGIIALIQTKNEILHMPEVLVHLDQYCDGIIMLDDGSTDGTYENAKSQKLLLKVQKDPVDKFDDLSLRNITLQLVSFFDTSWIFFIDADERFDKRYADLYAITKLDNIDSVCFQVVHLWNNKDYYRLDLPENPSGLLSRFRMFRSCGPLKINANRLLHFPATPYKRNRLDSKILIRHYGNVDPATRRRKYERYIKEDREGLTQGYSYEYLIEDEVSLRKVDELFI